MGLLYIEIFYFDNLMKINLSFSSIRKCYAMIKVLGIDISKLTSPM